MDQAKLSRPDPPRLAASVPSDADDESWLSRARDFATPGRPGFVQAVDSLRPGPLLCAVLEESVTDLSRHSDLELAAVLRASERLITYARYQQFLLICELARRGLDAPVEAG